MKPMLSDTQKQEIVDKYLTGNYTCAELGRQYNRHRGCINNMLRVRKITINSNDCKRTYKFNQLFFDVIDTEEKAYFLGLLYADGYASDKYIILSLQEEDRHIIDKFQEVLCSKYPLIYINRKKKNAKWKNCYRLCICSKYMSNKLIKLGCVQAKSLILKFPTEEQVPSHLIRHFVRGYFDGDGCFWASFLKRKNVMDYSVNIVSTKDFCESLKKIIQSELGIPSYLSDRKNGKTTRTIRIHGRLQIYKFLDWIYAESTVYLNRKHSKYLKFKQ